MKREISMIVGCLLALLLVTGGVFAQERVTSQAKHEPYTGIQSVWKAESETPRTSLLQHRIAGMTPITQETSPSPAPLAITADGRTVYGSVIYADTWTPDNAPYGIYSFPATGNTSLTLVHQASNMEVNGGGVYYEGRYYFTNSFQYGGATYANYYIYNTETWEVINAIPVSTAALASDMDFDPITKRIYGSFQRADLTGFQFGWMNPETAEVTPIANLTQMMYVVAINAEGKVYGVGADGNLYEIDKSTGALAKVGATGLSPQYMQSGGFDHVTGKLYWCASLASGTSGLYEVNLHTGKATLISHFPNNEEVTAVYIPQPLALDGAPAKVEELTLHFADGATTGTVEFTVPKKTFDGSTLSGLVDYTVWFNDSEMITGRVLAGGKVSKEVTVEAGMYTVTVRASNSVGMSPKSEVKQWIGRDVPTAVTNLRLKKSGSKKLTLSWDAPVAGLHNGYFDASAITYKVVRHPQGEVVSENQSETSFTETLDGDRLFNYWYEVTGYTDGLAGASAVSNKVALGTYCTVPYFEDFLSEEDFALFAVINSNVDDFTWEYEAEYHSAKCKSDTYEQMNDWLITPLITMGTDRVYKLTFKTRCTTPKFPETLKVAFGNSRSTMAMTTELIPATVIEHHENETMEAVIKVPAAGNYCIGFQSLSQDKFNLYVDSISIVEGAWRTAPAAVSGLTVTPAAQGELKATLAFTTPSTTIDGVATTVSKVDIYRDGSLIKTFNNPDANAALSYTDSSAKQGYNIYVVVASNANGQGLETKMKAYVGVDIPGKPLNVLVRDVDGANVVTWEAPATGATGGYIDPSTLTYTVQRAADNEIVARDIHELTFTESLEVDGDGQMLMAYYVWARSAAGEGEYAESNPIVIGEPYQLKFKESFMYGGVDSGPWGLINTNSESAWNTAAMGAFVMATPQDNDEGLATFSNNGVGHESTLYSAKITLKNTVRPMLVFYYYATPGSENKLQVRIAKSSESFETVDTIDFFTESQTAGWVKKEVDLSAFRSVNYIQLGFHAVAGGSGHNIHIDNIVVRDLVDYNLSVKDFWAPARLLFEKNNNIEVTVVNEGVKSASDYTVELYRDGSLVGRQEGSTLSPDAEKTYTFNEVPNLDFNEMVTYYAVVSYAADLKPEDNKTTEVSVNVQMPKYPAVDDLTATNGVGAAILSWSAPDLSAALSGKITDGAEDYRAFIINNVGDWKVVDVDGSLTYGISNGTGGLMDYDNSGSAMAFQVFNPSLLGLENSEWATYAGDQMFVAFSDMDKQNDDWLISPELTGKAHALSFYVNSASPLYQETYEVLYSKTDTELDSFQVIASEAVAPFGWTPVTIELPAGAKYFAIRCTSRDCYALFIDEITYASKSEAMENLQLEGYHVYRDNVKVTSTPITATTYTDAVADGTYTYKVTAIYNEGESVYSNEVVMKVSVGIEDNLAEGVSVYAADGSIEVHHAAEKRIAVYTLDGKLIYQGEGEDFTTIPASSGQYLVKADDYVTKVWVK